RAGYDPMYSPTFRIWGYETNFGSFAQFTRVQAHQCVPRPQHLTWEESAAYMLVGATAYRMLLGWDEHQVMKDDVVLIWGGAGGLGSMAIQIVKARGGVPIAVISSDEKREFCMSLGAKGCINRKEFGHWGMLPHWKDNAGYREWLKGARDFGKAIWDVLGERKNPRLVFEHPGESTIPTSIFVCETGGMVVICAGTTGYNATVDLRYLWMRQKRLQGSHFANDEQAYGINQMVSEGLVDPCLSETYGFDDLPEAHQLMYENRHPHGNMSILVNALELGSGVASAARGRAPLVVPAGERDQRAAYYTLPTPALDDGDELPDAITDGKKVRDFMTEGLLSCVPGDSVGYAATMMVQNHVHAIVVLDEGQAVGVVTQTDLVMARQNYRRDELLSMPVERIMTPNCETVEIDLSISDAITRLTRQRIHRLVVVDDGRAVGIVSMSDIVAQMVTNWPPKLPGPYTRD
ncbi:MAG: crotonyl-CoA carboxylase/reductase, partial [Myxococcales bacterium]|nr:crotonyl-CoA carboxylase/reductase [Myxococcales bacterium]